MDTELHALQGEMREVREEMHRERLPAGDPVIALRDRNRDRFRPCRGPDQRDRRADTRY